MNNSKEFDEFLEENIPSLPPQDVVREVTPFRNAMSKIITGLALCGITFEFDGLQYVLPTIGIILTLLGFRTLRKQNAWFMICFIVTAFNLGLQCTDLILNASVVKYELFTSLSSPLVKFNIALLLFKFVSFYVGIREVQKKAGVPVHAGGAAALIAWQLVVLYLAFGRADGATWIFFTFIIAYLGILYSLYLLSKELDEAGYVFKTIPGRWSDITMVIGIVLVLAIGITCRYLFCDSYDMDWSRVYSNSDHELVSVKQRLIKLGFPEDVLQDMTEEDIMECKDATRVLIDREDGTTISGRSNYEHKMNHQGIAVKLSEEDDLWRVIHYYQWNTEPNSYGTECIQINTEKQGAMTDKISGQILYDNNSVTYSAPYHSLDYMSYTKDLIIMSETTTSIFATFSLPNKGENYRGYVSYSIYYDLEFNLASYFTYTHQISWKQYPVYTAIESEQRWEPNQSFIYISHYSVFEISE